MGEAVMSWQLEHPAVFAGPQVLSFPPLSRATGSTLSEVLGMVQSCLGLLILLTGLQ